MTGATLTVRVIRNFEYRTLKNVVFHDIDLATTTVDQFKKIIDERIQTDPSLKIYRTTHFDTLKIYVKAQQHKTQNLAINLDHDDWILNDGAKTLSLCGIENETELSYFELAAYKAYQANPVQKWL
ncbi:hypothetical protein POMI540_0786 [Schizosaccharomyces pombe]|uniref:UPF0538 protein C2C4.04c n=1 Tax=Schizosaccharomyces pombe (strain 972 / ATCC 24843) TaxID=284812 RepID=YEY4_SCHPO|nr:uncharacterized protein SPAC2C4.04c [Schizosaccharomyces pombe]O14037.1 RecName: Full=UPF0538 protein C2C4.04c [Schizosaccharomyces pombe 972h-]CAB16364.1 conserved eukaryotic protein [Schizosaccharomyces pombe]|eukprot:NP_594507.1 uncharacterized protein SPAC2C4.04c [Schizosaccharomyces pombe]